MPGDCTPTKTAAMKQCPPEIEKKSLSVKQPDRKSVQALKKRAQKSSSQKPIKDVGGRIKKNQSKL